MNNCNKYDYFDKLRAKNDVLLLRITDALTAKQHKYKTLADVKAVIHNGKTVPASGKILVPLVVYNSGSPGLSSKSLVASKRYCTTLNEIPTLKT